MNASHPLHDLLPSRPALVLLAASLLCATGLASAHTIIQSVSASEQDNKTIVRIQMSGPVRQFPYTFNMQNPERIALDFLDTRNATGQLRHDIRLGHLQSLTLAQAGTRVRAILHVTQPATYTTAMENNVLVVTIHHNGAPAHPASRAPASSVDKVDVATAAEGDARVLVSLSDNKVPVSIRQQDNAIIAEFLHTRLDAETGKSITPGNTLAAIQSVSTQQAGDHVQLTIATEGRPAYQAYQADNRMEISVARAASKTPAPPRPAAKSATSNDKAPDKRNSQAMQAAHQSHRFSGAPLSLNFQDIEVRTVLQVIADFTGLNIIASDTVTGSLTIRMKNVPWDQALDIVMQSRNLDMRRTDSVLWIAPKEELLRQEKIDLEQQNVIRSLEPLHAEVFQLNYQKVDEFRKSFGITEDGGSSPDRKNTVLSLRGSAVIDKRTNQIFVTDTARVLENIRKLIARIDVPSRQVMIEARIVEAQDDFSYALGTKLGFSAKGSRFAVGNNYSDVMSLTGQASTGNSGSDGAGAGTAGVNLPATGTDPGSFAISLFNASASKFLNLELSALEIDGKGRILSSPRVVTADQQAALIEQGEELPYQQATSSGATSTAFRKANMKLEVTPQITPDGNVILTVDVNKDSRGEPTPGGLAINTKHVKTQVQIENGGTIVIGGIYSQTEQSHTNKVPFFGDIPIIGYFFKNQQQTSNKTELLIFLTPRIITEAPITPK